MTNKLVLASTAIALVASITMASAESIDITDAMRMSCDFNKNGFIDSPTTLFIKLSEATDAQRKDMSKENHCIKDMQTGTHGDTLSVLKEKLAKAKKETAELEKRNAETEKRIAKAEKESVEIDKEAAAIAKETAATEKAIDAVRAEIKRKLD